MAGDAEPEDKSVERGVTENDRGTVECSPAAGRPRRLL